METAMDAVWPVDCRLCLHAGPVLALSWALSSASSAALRLFLELSTTSSRAAWELSGGSSAVMAARNSEDLQHLPQEFSLQETTRRSPGARKERPQMAWWSFLGRPGLASLRTSSLGPVPWIGPGPGFERPQLCQLRPTLPAPFQHKRNRSAWEVSGGAAVMAATGILPQEFSLQETTETLATCVSSSLQKEGARE